MTTCSECGFGYDKEYPDDVHDHNIIHHKRVTTLRPVPSRALRAAMSKDAEAVWVTHQSPKWLRLAVYRRAYAFKRELRYSLVQWSINDDPDAIAYLLSDDDSRIIGACCFRPMFSEQPEKMELDWIWICPGARRQGWLSRHWNIFLERFGEFEIGFPISNEMQAFLRKRGLDRLIH